MKILYYSSPSFADCDFPLVRSLMEMGHDVTYLIELSPVSCRRTLFNIKKIKPINAIIPASDYDELQVYQNYLNLDKVYIVNNKKTKFSIIRSLLMTLKVARFIRSGYYNVLHTDMQFVGYQPLLMLLCKPWVMTMHDPMLHSEDISTKKNLYRRVSFYFCKKFVILNNNQLKRFCDFYHIPQSNVLVNRLGVYDNIHAFVQKKWQVKNKNVLFFGRITPYKGVEYLCEAMKIVHEVVPNATLTIAGGGSFYFDISKYEQLPYIEIRNHFVEMDELAKLVFQCSVVVCPYKEATQSGVIMTAFSMCKPVVATKVGGLGEMVEHGKSGLMVEPCDSNALAEAIVQLLSNENKLNGMSKFIKEEYIVGEKSWNAIAKRYIDFYNI